MDYVHTTTSGQRRELARKIFEEVRKEMRLMLKPKPWGPDELKQASEYLEKHT